MADVFLSYARPNAGAAKRIAQELEKAALSVWYDPDLPAHRPYSDVIAGELEAAKAVLVLWSGDAVISQWVRSEANRARELGKLVQARVDDARVPMPFDQIQCADLIGWRQSRTHEGWAQVRRSIEELVHGHPGPVAATTTGRPDRSRREVIVTGSVLAGASALGGGWLLLRSRGSEPHVSSATAALLQQAKVAEWQITHEGQNQALGLYRQVVADDPRFADGWGRLSMAYAWTAHYRSSAEARMLRGRARSAAQQAQAIDARNPLALTGLAMAQPLMGHWLPVNRTLREAVAKRPKLDDVSFHLALFLLFTGRPSEALKYMNLVLPAGPTPAVYFYQALMLWSAGRAEDLDNLLTKARALYPTHFALWFTQFYTAMYGGRPEAALALAADTTGWPTGIPPEDVEAVVRVAKAVQSQSPRMVDVVASEWIDRAHHGAGNAENAAQFLAALGRVDGAFSILRAYFFSEGFDCGEVRFSASQGTYTPHSDRLTHFLFFPSLAPLRSDTRFAKLLRDLRFTDYWRASRSPPDSGAS